MAGIQLSIGLLMFPYYQLLDAAGPIDYLNMHTQEMLRPVPVVPLPDWPWDPRWKGLAWDTAGLDLAVEFAKAMSNLVLVAYTREVIEYKVPAQLDPFAYILDGFKLGYNSGESPIFHERFTLFAGI
ncbi:hypothetical protein NLJ89_g5865 [Agrocybe chaxingu]|uniref:Uncharacterized protein n=1 Tax=Agrocybe chaxingu TaxID=84603 RepID=A0A9W8K1Q4_9AGAR|nr:hypothetical protein NLJ89_g5865 [Agrocybe chaxingu]